MRRSSKNRKKRSTGGVRREFVISVTTSPIGRTAIGSSMNNELQMLRPALLYADRVELTSASASMLSGLQDIHTLPTDEQLRLLDDLNRQFRFDKHGTIADLRRLNREMTSGKGISTRDRLVDLGRANEGLRRVWRDEALPIIEQHRVSAGANQLDPAIQEGILSVHPIVPPGSTFNTDRTMDAYLGKLEQTIKQARTYPLFDEETSKMVRLAIEEGMFSMREITRARGKEVGAATGFIEQLPTFHRATISEVLDIRSQLQEPLRAYRSAMVDISRSIKSDSFDQDFRYFVQDEFRAKVEPALNEIGNLISSSKDLRELAGQVMRDGRAVFGSVMTLIAAEQFGLHSLLAAAPLIPTVAEVLKENRDRRSLATRNSLFFLYQTNHLLD